MLDMDDSSSSRREPPPLSMYIFLNFLSLHVVAGRLIDGLKADPGTAKAKSMVGCSDKWAVSRQNGAIRPLIYLGVSQPYNTWPRRALIVRPRSAF